MEKGELSGALLGKELDGVGLVRTWGLEEAVENCYVGHFYSMNVIIQAFAGHLGDLELAVMSIANTVMSFNFGLMVSPTWMACYCASNHCCLLEGLILCRQPLQPPAV
ncbi:uncharacterized protein [Elaeis guineensis]|uniref:uncharacterized protein isoform X2 n=1 Tax=Elaeis guineensis var. tenera TaxID=51953 RepID=UPI003C6DB113